MRFLIAKLKRLRQRKRDKRDVWKLGMHGAHYRELPVGAFALQSDAEVLENVNIGLRILDPHRKKAAEIYGIPESQVTPEQRKVGKQENYRQMYAPPASIGRIRNPEAYLEDKS